MTLNKLYIYLLLALLPAASAAQVVHDTVVIEDDITITEETYDDVDVTKVATEITPPPAYRDRNFDDSFKEKYTGEEYQYETKPHIKTSWDRFLEWLANLLSNLFSFGNSDTGWGIVLIRILAFGVIGFVVYLIVRAILNKEGMWIFGRARKNIDTQTITEENIHQMDFRQLIEDTKSNGNYRLAVRYYFLWLLKRLSAREIIDWHRDKTNSDYLYEIKNDGLRKDFEYLSYVYDYSWYGEFPLDDRAFAKAEKAFQKTFNTI